MGEAARRCSASSQHERAFWDTRRESEAALLLPAWGRKGPSSQRLSRGSFTAFPHPTLGTAAAIREARANRGGAATAASPRHTGSTRTSRGAGRPPLLPAWLPSTATPLLPRRALTGGGPGGAALRGPRRAVSGDHGRWLPAAVPALPGPRRAVTGGGSRSRARPLVPAHPRPRTRTAPPPLPAMREQVPQLVPRRAGQSGRSARDTQRVWEREMGSELRQSQVPTVSREPMTARSAAAGPPSAGSLSQSLLAGPPLSIIAALPWSAQISAPHTCRRSFPTCELRLTGHSP